MATRISLFVTLIAILSLAAGFAWDEYSNVGPALLSDCPIASRHPIYVAVLADPESIEFLWRQYHKSKGEKFDATKNRLAFTILRDSGERFIFLPKLRGQEDEVRLKIWGHEFAHVICGLWHPQV